MRWSHRFIQHDFRPLGSPAVLVHQARFLKPRHGGLPLLKGRNVIPRRKAAHECSTGAMLALYLTNAAALMIRQQLVDKIIQIVIEFPTSDQATPREAALASAGWTRPGAWVLSAVPCCPGTPAPVQAPCSHRATAGPHPSAPAHWSSPSSNKTPGPPALCDQRQR